MRRAAEAGSVAAVAAASQVAGKVDASCSRRLSARSDHIPGRDTRDGPSHAWLSHVAPAPTRWAPVEEDADSASPTLWKAHRMSSSPEPPRLSDQDLQELAGLIRKSDSVELKLTVPDEDRRSMGEALGLDPLDSHLRQVYFFDTPDLALDDAGVVVRARRSQGKADDSVIKLRPVVPDDLPSDLRASKDFVVEVDALPGGYVCSGSFKGELDTDHVKEAVAGRRPVRKLFSKKQRAFYAAHAPEGIELDHLSILGPLHVLKLKFSPEGYERKLAVELWMYPDDSRILELSTKCRPKEAFQVAAESRVYLGERGVNLFGEQQTKTRTALEYFAREMDSFPAR